MTHPILEPGRIGPLALPNRVIKTATYEGMTPGGRVSDALVRFHAAQAAAGVGLTTVAYGAVAEHGRTFADQLLVDAEALPGLSRLAGAVHEAGGRVSLQLAHCGGFSKHQAPAGPSPGPNLYGLAYGFPWIRSMSPDDIRRVVTQFAAAADVAVRAGFDAVEVHCGHGYLLSQFLSPAVNRRRDAWGGDLQGRLRLPVAVVRAVSEAVGARAAVLAKINLDDGVRGGSSPDDAVIISRALVEAGADALVTSGGLVQRSAFFLMRGGVPIRRMAAVEPSLLQRVAMRAFAPFVVRGWPYESGFFLEPGRRVVAAVDAPVVALGGMDSAAVMREARAAGFGFVALGRALLADPMFVRRLEAGEDVVSRCTHCNDCVAAMDQGGVRCTLTEGESSSASR